MKTLKIAFIALVGSLLSTSCLVDDEAPTQNQAQTQMAAGFVNSSETVSYFTDQGTIEHEFYYELKGGMSGFNTTTLALNYEVDAASTAQAGVEYDFVSTDLTIEPFREFGILKINVHTGNFDANSPTELILNLSSTNALVPTAYETVKIIFIGCQSGLAGTYTNPDLPSGAAGQTNFVETTPNNFTFTMPFLGFNGGVDPIEMYMVDICGEVTLLGWEVETAVSGDVTVDPVTGAISIEGLVIYNEGVVDANDVWFDLGDTVYTPL